MLVPTNEDYRWVHDQHEKWDNVTKEKMRHLDQIIDGHLGWYNTHKTSSDIIRTRRALPDINLPHKRPRKRKLSDVEEVPQVTENVFIEEDNITDKSDHEENEGFEKEEKEKEEGEEENIYSNQMQKETDLKESERDDFQNDAEETLKANNSDGHLNPTLQVDKADASNNFEDADVLSQHDKVEVVTSIRIRPSILKSLDEPPKPLKSSFISRLLNLSKNKASPSTTTSPSSSSPEKEPQIITNTQVNEINNNTYTTDTSQTVVEAHNNTLDDQTSNQVEWPNPSNEEHDIVVSEVIPEPRHRFQSKKKKIQEKTITQDDVSKVDNSISSTRSSGSNKVIREIDDDEEMEPKETPHPKQEEPPKSNVENKGTFVPHWAKSPELEKHLERQQSLNPEKIFGEIKPIKLKDIFQRRESSSSTDQPNDA